MSHELEAQVFADVLVLPSGERSAFLDKACAGDTELRRRIEMLIQAHEAAGGSQFMAARANDLPPENAGTASPFAVPGETAGTWIGRYKLLQKLGEGGCGIVWMAEQNEPVHRRVALKVIKLGMDTKAVIARFDAERQALAIMDHPNIAHALDAGATDAGRPYFVMELVRGIRITDYCDQHNLSTTQRLELFTQVCSAVQHAHQKGIIHRDLKPSNILVTVNESGPVPKVIDFGIAKATQGRLTDLTVFTAFEQFIGTPAYMSPEQAELTGVDIDTRSDIYSLGVLLYELLTGRPPFDPKTLLEAGLDEIRRIIREVEPPKPSTNLSTLNETDRRTLAKHRGTDPVRLSLLLRGDLDWIVMKALEKNRARRYETASALSADIVRHLHDEPVSARPPSTAYRVGKLVRRHRLAFAAVVAVTLSLLTGLAASTWQAVRATRAERNAETERSKAEAERVRAEDLLGFMLGDLRTQVAKVGRLDVLESVSVKALAYFATRPANDLDDPTLVRHAKALSQIGQIRMDQARYPEASAAFTEAYSRTAALSTRHPRDGDILFERSQAEYWVGFVFWKKGDLAAATDWLTRYHDTSAALAALDPENQTWSAELSYSLHNLAVLDTERVDLDKARAEFLDEVATVEKLLPTQPANLELRFQAADAHSWLGGIAERLGDFKETVTQYTEQSVRLEQLVREEPRNSRWQYELANARLYLAGVQLVLARNTAAQELLSAADKQLGELVAHDPANRHWLRAALSGRLIEIKRIRWQGDHAAALSLLAEIRPQWEKLQAAEPTDRTIAFGLMTAWRLEAQLRLDARRPDALAAAARVLDLGESLLRAGSISNLETGECAQALVVAGAIAFMNNDGATARLRWQHALELLAPQLSDTRDWRLLDPAVRATVWLDRGVEAQGLIQRLNSFGYIPLDAWPTGINGVQPETHNNPNNKK